MTESNFPFLMTMKDKNIQVFKGGPESKTGKLVDVKSDYLILATKDSNVIYYQLKHLKSVIEDSQGNPLIMDDREDEECEEACRDFLELLESLISNNIRVNQGGPESRTGRLLVVKPDYLAISTKKDGVVYYNLEHVKSVSEVPDKKQESSNHESSESSSSDKHSESSDNKWSDVNLDDISPPCMEEEDFHALLCSIKLRWVTINSGGPEKLEGVLVECFGDYVTIIHNKDVFKVATFHIKNIRVASNEEVQNSAENEEESSDNSNENENKSDNKNDDKDRNNREGKSPNPFKQRNRSRGSKR